ncbi:MAG: hypothetical protein IKO42_01515, partial [Opitutales bacterium]|nr:hypothetical protein [Opitutales bacterium]
QIPLAAAIALLALEFFLGTRRTFGRRGASFAIALLAVPAFLAPENAFAQGGQQEKPKAEAAAPSEKTSEPKNWREYFNAGVDCAQKSDANAARENFFKAIALSANDIPVHAKSYYNIGCADYNAAKKSFEKIEIQEAAQKAQNASLQAQGAIQSSSQVLQKGLETLKNSGEEALKDQGLQNEIKGEISKCGQAKKLLPEAEKDIQKIRGEIKNASAQTLSAQKNFENAAELAPEMQSASRNLSAAKNAVKSMSNFDSEFKKSAEGFGELNKALERNIEELKKLLRDDNKDNQQNQDNQNQQDNQDNKQNQNQQDNQNNQNNQQSKDNQNSQNQKSDSSQQNQQNQDKQDSSRENGQENQQQNQKENSDKNKESSPQDRQQSGDENKNRGDENKQKPQNENGESQKSKDQGDLKKQNEQAAKPENENKTGESSARQEHAAEKKDEAAAMPEKSAQEAAAQKDAQAAAEEAKAQESPDYRAQAGVMTRREASQVLDSMKEGEKKLPFSGYGNQRSRFEEKNYKDW